MFLPEILRPSPDPSFVRELRRIDPDLQVVFGYDRYLVKRWAIERKLPAERYFTIYASILESGGSRFVEQPIYDSDKPIYNSFGEVIGHERVGTRKYDLAPEYEWVMFTDTLDARVLSDLRRAYAWERNHPLSRMAFEKAQEQEERQKKRAELTRDIGMEGVKEGWRLMGRTVQGQQPSTVMEGTEL